MNLDKMYIDALCTILIFETLLSLKLFPPPPQNKFEIHIFQTALKRNEETQGFSSRDPLNAASLRRATFQEIFFDFKMLWEFKIFLSSHSTPPNMLQE